MRPEPAFRDFVVFIPGIMGSSLSKNGRRIWGLSAGPLVRLLASGGHSLDALALPDAVDGPADDGVTPDGLLGDLHVIPGLWSVGAGYSSIRRWLLRSLPLTEVGASGRPGNLLCFAYDWRLSSAWNAERLKAVVEPALHAWRAESGHPARLVIIGYSMGGLIGKWYAGRLDQDGLTRTLVTMGTPHRGSVKALAAVGAGGRFRGPSHLKAVVETFPSIYELMPSYACVNTSSGLQTITELGWNSASPHVRRAAEFQAKLDAGEQVRAEFYAFTGMYQDTETTLASSADGFTVSSLIDGEWRGGDGTVPAFAARPTAWRGRDYRTRGVQERHGSLTLNPGLRDELLRILTEDDRVFRSDPTAGVRLDVDMDAGSSTTEVVVRAITGPGRLLQASLVAEDTAVPSKVVLRETDPGHYEASLGVLSDGAYVVGVTPYGSQAAWRTHCPFFIVDGELLS